MEEHQSQNQSRRKVRKGVVVSDKMNKTAVVRVERVIRHPRYEKVITRWKKYYAHDENNQCKNGDVVTIEETRPYSKTKCWRVVANQA